MNRTTEHHCTQESLERDNNTCIHIYNHSNKSPPPGNIWCATQLVPHKKSGLSYARGKVSVLLVGTGVYSVAKDSKKYSEFISLHRFFFFFASENIRSPLLNSHEDAFISTYPLLLVFPLLPSSPRIGESRIADWMKRFTLRSRTFMSSEARHISSLFNSSSSISSLKFYGIGYCLMQSTSGP